ncbi:hypothetical protein A3G63_01180 [Candidatus Kaiserbacteria bacterium RIFCSPLOWO2_12_FULL_52_8]|uniref:Uncharacterized protein n=1 Tax=Candidatus Kaiserbacteria bacterium RIFCSPHIGHO2_01_FULL_53_31 TaxID=1798481 RepID=A0A1F6CH17_9BACT|nr:MAG: hypothetical protein A2678_01695 [Candidatus Kaiserbacteria bacterium RIFCSPHIGHO2_01_FULL_53_31]OGG93612.1 MAG: hypothetical protein A3G63_01180 [Candidatus Kaiserbacteria bacterium RIFCSPLOWO2_12_FULL_52_8]
MPMNNLTPRLTSIQIRENIDALQKGGMSNDKIQAYVNNYTKTSDGNYILKSMAQARSQGTAASSAKQNNANIPAVDPRIINAPYSPLPREVPVISPPAPPPAPVTQQVVTPLPPVAERPSEVPSPIHTYSEDFSDRIKTEHASTATVLAAEQDAARRSEPAPSVPSESPKSRILFVTVGVVLIALSVGGIYYAYARYIASHAVVTLVPTISAPIFTEEQERVTGQGAVLIQAIGQSMSRSLSAGAVRLLYTDTASTSPSVFSNLQSPAPSVLLRNLRTRGSMAGIVNVGGTQSPFFVLSVSSYNDTYAGMLWWESTMANDLRGLFPPYPSPTSALSTATTTATTTPLATTTVKTKKAAAATPARAQTTAVKPPPVFVPAFRDEIVANHDVRVYRDALGRSLLLYGYWNQTTLVIARDPEAFIEILGRLANSRTES